ncbi:SGNH/GDSL hydrolase family protein [Boudabousia liubingyangii]|uniref:SGNH/GDSL hydrolase family protein n=1 Tax=Boudabousia liubingyangii TaxID=1921764 RepID=UPI000ACAA2E3|nr:SGNH/GDSL hydrolase family protein [Boudabousia liubingyangii]
MSTRKNRQNRHLGKEKPAAKEQPVVASSAEYRVRQEAGVPAALPAEAMARYVAIGDSFSEGLMDPGANGRFRGWTDRLAAKFSGIRTQAGLPETQYANLAIRGKLLAPIIEEQLPRALELEPTVVSLVGGGNDLLRPKSTPDRLAALLESGVQQCLQAGAAVILCTSSNAADGGLIEKTRGPNAILNSHIWSIARRYPNVFVIDQWGLAALRTWPAWAADRIHLTPTGHEVLSRGALNALGWEFVPDHERTLGPGEVPIPTDVPVWQAVPEGWAETEPTWQDDLAWVRRDFLPWVGRHLRGRSSGDRILAKRPELLSVSAY